MTKLEAIEAMKAGKKVRHRYFQSHEWVTIKNGLVVFEDGCTDTPEQFWRHRSIRQFDTDWEIVAN